MVYIASITYPNSYDNNNILYAYTDTNSLIN